MTKISDYKNQYYFGDTYETVGTKISNVDEIKKKLPYKPYCADILKHGLKIFPREEALKQKYIQLNPPDMKIFITFDLDYDTWPFVNDDVSLPPPLWFVQRRASGHAHLIYGLATPVCTSENAHEKPQKILDAIINAYRKKLNADPCYVGLISKNPFSDFWRVVQVCEMFYSLEYLASFVDLPFEKRKRNTLTDDNYAVLGRNCFLFVSAKNWAYLEIKKFWERNSAEWFDAVLYQVQCENMKNFPETPLPEKEVRSIAKSVAIWTWEHITPETFSKIQSRRRARHTLKYSEKDTGIELLKLGFSTEEIMQELGVSERTCYRWKEELPGQKINLSEAKPWETEGISRATWYRKQKINQEKSSAKITKL